ncbi:MAG: hypothetical protein JNL08_16930 [Planctomycetes bacterium]|nr:hypothetical protein [Planctomycetota bacterium]
MRTRPGRWLLALATAATATAVPGQSVAERTAALARAATVDEAMVGDDGERTETYRTYERWRDRAATADLLAALQHAAPTVRAYAARALVEREERVDWTAALRPFLRDTAVVTTRSGCCCREEAVGDVVFTTVRPRLTDDQLQDFAEAAIRGRSPLYAREWALRHLRLRDGMLHEVRALARSGEAVAAIALARYRLPGDAPILVALLRQPRPFDDSVGFLAAAEHRDPSLLPALVDLADAARRRLESDNPSRLRFWLQAIAAQRSEPAGAFLAQFLRTLHPGNAFAEGDLLATIAAVLEPHADVAAFAAVRAELAQRQRARGD